MGTFPHGGRSVCAANRLTACGAQTQPEPDFILANWKFLLLGHSWQPMKLSPVLSLAVLMLASRVLSLRAAVLHVHSQGNDVQSGSDWSAAKRTIASALESAATGDEIWVAAGTYSEHLLMKDGVGLYGGFEGLETLRAQRDWLTHRTILDGSTNGVVLTLKQCGASTTVDGFTIQMGSGTGILCKETAGNIRNNLIRGNAGDKNVGYGGGILVSGPSSNGTLLIESNRITDNVNFDGGGIACIDASPRIERNVITWNLAYQNGGGISCWRNSSPRIANNLISGNTASWIVDLPVPVGGGGIFATADDLDGRPHPTAVSSPIIVNNVLAANGGRKGGGIALVDSNGGVPAVINNTVFANNGAGLFWGSSSLGATGMKPRIFNNLIAFNPIGLEMEAGTPLDPNIGFNCVYENHLQGKSVNYRGLPDWTGTNGNISLDPRLANYPFGNSHLQPHSPCIDAGTHVEELAGVPDVDDQNRVQGAAVDIGADESDGTAMVQVPSVIRVRSQGNDAADGSTWASAKRTIQAAIDRAKAVGGEVWVASGTYTEHIVLPAFVYLYGGFSGTETERAARNIALNPVILDGAGVIKVVQCGNGGYLVSALDGFTVRNGGKYTAGAGLNQYGAGGLGGGIYLGVSSPYLANNLITHNSLAQDNSASFPQPASYGAGIYCELSYAVIEGNTIQENEILNTFDGSGAGLYCAQSMPVIQRNIFSQNHAKEGSAIYGVGSTMLIRNNVILSNAMYNTYPLPLYLGSASGAIHLSLAPDFLIEGNTIQGNLAAAGAGLYASVFRAGRIQNNLFLYNSAQDSIGIGGLGGGMYCLVSTNATSTVAIVNNTFVGNAASTPFGEQGGALAFSLLPPADNLLIANNLIVSNSSGIFQTPATPRVEAVLLNNNLFNTRSNYINLTAATNDLSCDPLFRNGPAGDFHLQTNSPCLDAGSAFLFPASDLEQIPRPLDADGDGIALPDLGAFESVLATADSDRDTMPDGWELANLLNPALDDGTQDLDGDGMCNAGECIAGTSAGQPGSVLRLEAAVELAKSRLTLRWKSVAGRFYGVEVCNALGAPGAWQALPGYLIGTGDPLEWNGAIQEGACRIYRITVRKGE